MGIFQLTTGGAIGMLGAGLAVCLAGAGSARGTALSMAWSPHPGHQRTSWSLLKSAGVYL